MIDLHSHILPELDDGARSLEEALAMARMAVDSGVTAMAATPHCARGRAGEVLAGWQLLAEALREARIPLKLFPGMEIYGTRDTARLLTEGKLLTLNGSRYPLVEFDFQGTGWEETRILQELREAGFRPVAAHPERYDWIRRDPGLLDRWIRMGCLIQVNRGSLLGRFGRQARQMAMELVERGFVSAVASDAHSSRTRTPWMADVHQMLSRDVSDRCAGMMLRDNPMKILKNEDIPPAEPEWFA